MQVKMADSYPEEDTAVGINVWPWVLGLAVLKENIWRDLVDLGDQLEQWVVWQMFQGKLTLACVSWIGLTQDSVTVAGQNLARLECGPNELLDLLISWVVAQSLLGLLDPDQDFLQNVRRILNIISSAGTRGENLEAYLVSQTVQWTGQTVHSSSK